MHIITRRDFLRVSSGLAVAAALPDISQSQEKQNYLSLFNPIYVKEHKERIWALSDGSYRIAEHNPYSHNTVFYICSFELGVLANNISICNQEIYKKLQLECLALLRACTNSLADRFYIRPGYEKLLLFGQWSQQILTTSVIREIGVCQEIALCVLNEKAVIAL